MSNRDDGLPIAVVAARTGVSVATLRQWEHRFGFPTPVRLPGGHRRYTEGDVAAIGRIAAERDAGRSVEAAIAVARAELSAGDPDDTTLFAALRRRRPDLVPLVLERRAMLAISRAIEDECVASGARAHLAVAFQRASTYRHARRRRWNGLSRTAASTIVFADFRRSRVGADGVREVAIPAGAPQEREWAVVCDAPASAAVLAGWERDDGRFEAVWTVEPAAVRAASVAARAIARHHAPTLDLPEPPGGAVAPDSPAVARALAVTSRVIAYLGDPR